MATAIEPLKLTQGIEIDDGTTIATWYGWLAKDGVTWGRTNRTWRGEAGRGPDYSCEITIPALMCGDASEIQSDIVAALHRHAFSLGLES